MEGSKRLETNVVADSGVWEVQGSGAASQGRMPTGRKVVQRGAEVVQESSQMAVASDEFQRTVGDHAIAATSVPEPDRNAAHAEESIKIAIRECEYKPTECFDKMVRNAVANLSAENKVRGAASLRFCLIVVKNIDRLKDKCHERNKYQDDTSEDNYNFMMCQLGPYYNYSLRPALETLKEKAAAECSWEYYQEFELVARYLDVQSGEYSDENTNREFLQQIAEQFLDNEIHYLEQARLFPSPHFVKHSGHVVDMLLTDKSSICRYKLISREKMREILDKKNSLVREIMTKVKAGEGGPAADIEQLREKCLHKSVDMKIKRQHHDLLQVSFWALRKKANNAKSSQECFLILEELYQIYTKCIIFMSEFNILRADVKKAMLGVARRMLENSIADGVKLKKEFMGFIDKMKDEGLLNAECKKCYLYCQELPDVPQAIKADRITAARCEQDLSEMEAQIREKEFSENAFQVADRLKNLLSKHGDEIRGLSREGVYLKRINQIKTTLDKKMFSHVLDKFNEYRSSVTPQKCDDEMSGLCSECVRLTPYSFVLIDKKRRMDWVQSACSAWRNEVARLSGKTVVFKEENVDFLLALKRIAPDAPNPCVRILLNETLTGFFSNISLPGRVSRISAEKIMTLTQWIDELIRLKGTSKQQQEANDQKLKELSENWKKANEKAIVIAVPDQFVPDTVLIRPESSQPSARKRKSSMPITKAGKRGKTSFLSRFP